MILETFWFASAKLISLTGVPSVPISLTTSFGFACLYYLWSRKKYRHYVNFPLKIPFAILLISRFLTCFTALAGIGDEASRFVGYLFSNVIETLLIWRIVETEKDFAFIFKGLVVVFLIAGLYGIIEFLTESNFIGQYKSSLMNEEMFIYHDVRGYRIMSIFEHPLGAGMNFGLFAVFIMYITTKLKTKIHIDVKIIFATAILAIICVFLTKMRSGIFFTLIFCLVFFQHFNRKTFFALLLVSCVFIVVIPFMGDTANIFLSIFDSKAQDEIGGSSSDMRFNQLYAVFKVMEQHPLTGAGDQCLLYLNDVYSQDLLALESIYFEELVKHGIIGMGATIVMMYFTLIHLPRKFHSKEVFFLSLAYWATYSLTSIPFFRMNMFYLAMFYFIKKSAEYKRLRHKCLR